jgi:hypothetical protein
MSSDNPSGAVNQQERLFTSGWLVGSSDEPTANDEARQLRRFVEVIGKMHLRAHLTVHGLIEIAEIVETMNFLKPSELLRILRDHTPTSLRSRGEKMRWSGPGSDVGRLAETTARRSRRNAT